MKLLFSFDFSFGVSWSYWYVRFAKIYDEMKSSLLFSFSCSLPKYLKIVKINEKNAMTNTYTWCGMNCFKIFHRCNRNAFKPTYRHSELLNQTTVVITTVKILTANINSYWEIYAILKQASNVVKCIFLFLPLHQKEREEAIQFLITSIFHNCIYFLSKIKHVLISCCVCLKNIIVQLSALL